MKKVKLLSVLLALVMVVPLVMGIGSTVSANNPVMQVLVYSQNPSDKGTIESLKLPAIADYSSGSFLTNATKEQIKQLQDNNIDFVVIGRADSCAVNGYNLELTGKSISMGKLNNEKYDGLAHFDYPKYDYSWYILKMVGPMKRAWIDKINSTGATVMDGYPLYPDTYLVKSKKANIENIKAMDFVQAAGIYNPVLKTVIWPTTPDNKQGFWQTVNITIVGNITGPELQELTGTLKVLGCKSLLRAHYDRILNAQPLPKNDAMSDEEYTKYLETWNEEHKAMVDQMKTPVSDTEKTTWLEMADRITMGTMGTLDQWAEPFEGRYEVGFIRCVIPIDKIVEISMLPWVLNIDTFSAPEAQNDIANWQIGSQWAWAANEPSGVVTNPTDPLPNVYMDHFGLHGESLEFTPTQYEGNQYRQLVAVCGTGLDTGDLTSYAGEYRTSSQYGAPTGDFANRVVDHLAYTSAASSACRNWSNRAYPGYIWMNNNRRCPRQYWSNLNVRIADFQTGVVGSRNAPWMDWDGHETHVTGSGFGDGFWSRNQTHPADTAADRNPYDMTGTGLLPGTAPGNPARPNDRLPRINGLEGSVYSGNQQATGNIANDYRGVAYRAGIIVQRVTDANFMRANTYFWWPINAYLYYWAYNGRPRYLGLYSSPLPEAGYLRAYDAVFTILNDAYNLGARIHVDAWVMPHRGANMNYGPNSAYDRELSYNWPNILNSNEYNFAASQMDRYCWERKDMLIVQAGTTNTRLAAPFIYDWEPINVIQNAELPAGANNWTDAGQTYNSPWCFTKPPMFTTQGVSWPPPTFGLPDKGVYFPPVGDTAWNLDPADWAAQGKLPQEFNYRYDDITQPPTMDTTNFTANLDGKVDYATSCLSPATAKNPIVCGASESYRSIQTLPAYLSRGAMPWTYGAVYGPWFPQTVGHSHVSTGTTSPLFPDNTANSDAPAAAQHAGGAFIWRSELQTYPVPGGAHLGYAQVAAFSGRGPTPDLDYSQSDPDPAKWSPAGRIKPDIVAPGTQIMSIASYLTLRRIGDNNSGNQYDGVRMVTGANTTTGRGGPYLLRHPAGGTLFDHYAIMEGTSCATGFVAGAAAVTRQFYMNRGLHLYPQPTSALLKATLIHGATNLGGQYQAAQPDSYGASYPEWRVLSAKPNYDQGFGRLNIKKSLFPDAPATQLYEDHVSGITTGERHYYYYDITNDTVPLEVTMCYTDMPKIPQPQVALANDLDLTVVAPDGTEYHGNIYNADYKVDQHTPSFTDWG